MQLQSIYIAAVLYPLLVLSLPLSSLFSPSTLRNLPFSLINNRISNHANLDFDEPRLIQLSENEAPVWVNEQEKLRLKRKGINFFDITELINDDKLAPYAIHQQQQQPALNVANNKESNSLTLPKGNYTFPKELSHLDEILNINANISKLNLYNTLANFTSFHSRYYKSNYGFESAEWLFRELRQIVALAPQKGIEVTKFNHSWPQFSIIVTIPGSEQYKSLEDKGKVVVVGAHQDSTNLLFPNILPAPGADDDGSGTVTLLESLRLLLSADSPQFKPKNTVEYHFYAAEEGGLLGSQDVFANYRANEVDVVSHLQQDMTGYSKNALEKGLPEHFGIVSDYTDPGLSDFLKLVIDKVAKIKWFDTECGYGCSDHASSNKFGYQSAFAFESKFDLHNNFVHSVKDTIDKIDFNHVKEFVKLTNGYIYELGLAKFWSE